MANILPENVKITTPEEFGKQALKSIEVIVNDKTGMTVWDCVERQIPKTPTYEGDGYSDGHLVYDTWICPNCGKYYEVDYDNYNYCPNCGQRLDLSEV